MLKYLVDFRFRSWTWHWVCVLELNSVNIEVRTCTLMLGWYRFFVSVRT